MTLKPSAHMPNYWLRFATIKMLRLGRIWAQRRRSRNALLSLRLVGLAARGSALVEAGLSED